MSDHEEKYLIFLKSFHDGNLLPLKLGSNPITSEIFPELSNEKIILFNVDLLNEREAYLRTFNHFPLRIKQETDSIPSQDSESYLRKSTLIKIYSILNIQIFPLFTKNPNYYFLFQGKEEECHGVIKNDNKQMNNQTRFDGESNNINDTETILDRADSMWKENKGGGTGSVGLNDLGRDHLINTNEIKIESSDFIKEMKTPMSNPEVIPRKIRIIFDDEEMNNSFNDDSVRTNENEIIRLHEEINQVNDNHNKASPARRITRSSSSELIMKRQTELLKNKRKRTKDSLANIIGMKHEPIIENLSNNVRDDSREPEINIKLIKNEAKAAPCTICLEPMSRPSRLDKCDHEFCKECIDKWATLSNSCPNCKEDFRKIIYWERDKKLERKVKKRKFKYDEEEEDPWYNNCAEACMVCNKSNDEHLLLVCDKCAYNICHTYCAGLDLIPDEDWLCEPCRLGDRTRRTREEFNSNSKNMSPLSLNNISSRPQSRRQIDELKSASTRSKSKTKNPYTEESNNINIPISCKLQDSDVKRNSVNLNVNVNLSITNKSSNIRHIHIKSPTHHKAASRPSVDLIKPPRVSRETSRQSPNKRRKNIKKQYNLRKNKNK